MSPRIPRKQLPQLSGMTVNPELVLLLIDATLLATARKP